MQLADHDMARFRDLVYARSHLSFSRTREAQLRRWIEQRASGGRYRSFHEYFLALNTDPLEFEALIALITTRETYFFRMPDQFEVLKADVLPAIINREGKRSMAALSRRAAYRMSLRAWSAGCATGQETYSLSMQILDRIPYAKAWDIRVLGTDINAAALDTAREGRYRAAGPGSIPLPFRERYLEPSGANEIYIGAPVRAISEFQTVNLRNLPGIISFKEAFDIIFCRNVMIYFDFRAQQRLVSALWDCLRPGGYLFTGEGEVLHLYEHSFRLRQHGGCIYYQRPEEDEHVSGEATRAMDTGTGGERGFTQRTPRNVL